MINGKLHAFTLVEVLVSLVLMSIISFITFLVLGNLNKHSDSIKDMQCKEAAEQWMDISVELKSFFDDSKVVNECELKRKFQIIEVAEDLGRIEIFINDQLEQYRYVQL